MTLNKKKVIIQSLVCVTANVLISCQALAQIQTPHLPQNKWLFLTEEQFQAGHYVAAVQSASNYLQQQGKFMPAPVAIDALDKAKYYLAIAQLKINDPGAVDSASRYISVTANPAYKQRTAYALAQYYFQNEDYATAIPYYEMAGISNLSNAEIANAKFELAYSYFITKQFDKAEPLFASIRGIAGNYTSAGHYYHGLLSYNQGEYKEALESFEKIKNEREYQNVVPYYIAEIEYFSGNKAKALQDALRLIRRSEKSYYDNELHLLAAQVLFEDQRFGEALPYFEQYYNNVEKIRKEDLYEMAYSYYRVNEWQHAIEKFKPLSNTQDTLGQTAMYLLGDCYLKIRDKKSARNAFTICADMPFNAQQREASLLLSAKLSYELGYADEAMIYTNRLLSEFPNTKYQNEANTLRSDLLIKTSNYAEAYNTLQQVTKRDAAFKNIYQRVTYGYAMQQMQAGHNNDAYSLLGESIDASSNNAMQTAAYFWRGDLAYRLNRFAEVLNASQRFVQAENTYKQELQYLSPTATLPNAYLNMGYASMELNDFSGAQSYFNRAQQNRSGDATIAMNATLREADAVFMQKDYVKAASLYDKIIAANAEDADYARYQKAIVLGLQRKNAEKSSLLLSLVNQTPPSAYASNARYELALVYIEDDKYQAAINMLQPLTEGAEKRNLAPKAWIKIGFAQQQLNNEEKAIDAYRRVVVDYPASEERLAALDALKALYIESNQPAAYAQLLKDNNLSADSDNSLDSTYYSAAEARYASGKWEAAEQSLSQYLQHFPTGIFANKAHYYKAESHYQQKEYKEALIDYAAVLNNAWSDFTENSARRASTIAYQNKDYTAAMKYYGMLRNSAMGKENLLIAYNGLLQSSYNLGNYDDATAYADTLSTLPDIDETSRTNVLLYKARALQQNGKHNDALPIFQQLQTTKVSSVAAEARFRTAETYFKQDKQKEAEEAAGNTIKNSSGNDFWVVKSYILLADILTKQKDYFNAKATLQSVVKNTKIAELKQEATTKLEHVKALEKSQSKLSEE